MTIPTMVRDILRQHSSPRRPQETGWQPILTRLRGIRAVLFDIYGTLFVSSARSIGVVDPVPAGVAFGEALAAVGLTCLCTPDAGAQRLSDVIRSVHAEGRRRGHECPEVDILEVWRRTLESLMDEGVLADCAIDAARLARLAVEFECRTNPVWPMPHLRTCWDALRAGGVRIGLISNAQFYTPELFPALLGGSAETLGVTPQLQFYSYVCGAAKPGTRLFLTARETLRKLQIRPEETLCVGNDMRNDVVPAAAVGFRTALFAGDRQSLGCTPSPFGPAAPDLVLTDLAQLPSCLGPTKGTRRDGVAWYRAW